MKYLVLASLLLLSGCTVKLVDARLSREELKAAFDQRDKILVGITKELEALKAKEEKATKK